MSTSILQQFYESFTRIPQMTRLSSNFLIKKSLFSCKKNPCLTDLLWLFWFSIVVFNLKTKLITFPLQNITLCFCWKLRKQLSDSAVPFCYLTFVGSLPLCCVVQKLICFPLWLLFHMALISTFNFYIYMLPYTPSLCFYVKIFIEREIVPRVKKLLSTV